MSIAITLDKSTFQGLSYSELIQLHRYYIMNITPLLVSEILGDLSKEQANAKKVPKAVVIELANKIFPANTYVNAGYKKLLEISLLGKVCKFSNRPYLDAAKSVNTGKIKGFVFEETEQEKSIRRWRNGEFNSIDEILSWFWREQNNSENVIEEFRKKIGFLSNIKLNNKSGDNFENLNTMRKVLFDTLAIEGNQIEYLTFIIDFFAIDYKTASQIFYRWESENHKFIYDFSPYASFCLNVIAMYFVGINNNLFSERKTNLLDLEYLFYTPCAQVFSTNDKFLINLFNVLMPENVIFISATNLKNDLSKFHKYQTDTNSISDRPPDKDTETFRIWDKVFDLKLADFLKAHPKSQEKLQAEFENILEASENGLGGNFDGEPDFVTKNYYMQATDPCVCGSGKQLKDCCLLKGKSTV